MDRIRNDNGWAGRPYRTAGRLLAAVLLAALAGLVHVPAALAVPPAVGAVPSAGTAADVPGARWRWPLAGTPQVLRGFEPPPSPYAAGHRGVDLAAPVGAAVLAAGAGVVGYAGMLAGRGVVTVVHGALRTTYEPVTTTVHAGQPVARGTVLGHLQAGTHCGLLRPCLHWGLLRGRVYLDPLALLGLAAVRLLPVWEADRSTGDARGNAAGEGPGSPSGRAAGGAAHPVVGPPAVLERHGAAAAPDPVPAAPGRTAGTRPPAHAGSSSTALARHDRGHGAAGGLVLTLVLLAGGALLPPTRRGRLGGVSPSGR